MTRTTSPKGLRRILWIEDNEDYCRRVLPQLERLPASVTVLASGDKAIDRLSSTSAHTEPFDLVILAMRVPHSRGGNVDLDQRVGQRLLVEQLRPYQLLPPGTPFIVFTGHPSYEDCVRSVKAGAYDYLPKTTESGGSNLPALVRLCRKLLFPEFDELQRWLTECLPEVVQKHRGGFVGILTEDETRSMRVGRGARIGGRLIVSGATVQAVRQKLLRNKDLRWYQPTIVKVPEQPAI